MPKTLLLADDSVTIQKVVGISFASEDIRLVTVDNGDDAIARARELRPDLVLADVVMPGRNGYEVCEALKSDPNLCHIPVLLLTGTFEAFDEERARAVGASGHVSKPFEAQSLVDQVNRLLAAAPAAPPPAPSPPVSEKVSAAAPMPAGSPLAAPAPSAPGPAPETDEAFDFFDDDLGEIAGAEPVGAAGAPVPLEFESDASFSFEAEAPLRGPATAEAPLPDPPETPPDQTIAILPDAGVPDAPAAPPTRPSGPPAAPPTDPGHPGEDLRGAQSFGPPSADPTPPAPGREAFDFDFDFEPGAGPAARATGPGVGSDDLAQATVLDPIAGSGFDVSSSDLGDPLSAGPFGAPAPDAPAPRRDAAEALTDRRPAATPAGGDEGTPDAEWMEPLGAADAAEDEALPAMAAPRVDAPRPAPRAPAPEGAETPVPFDSRPFETPTLDPAGADPADAAEVELESVPETAGLDANAALEAIAPQLRTQIHDTLEKIAWESFSDVTERIVRQAIERVEQVAWEVIPQLAETLIREEIRRMKAEAGSD